MTDTPIVPPVKYFVAILYHDATCLTQALTALEQGFGPPDFSGADHPFDSTDYYQGEMGSGLVRRLVGFAREDAPESLIQAKWETCRIEQSLAREGKRTVNLDVGYLDHAKVVLASLKSAGQKIHLGQGIWADLVGRWSHGRYAPFDWTFPDFKSGRYDRELAELRRLHLESARRRRQNAEA